GAARTAGQLRVSWRRDAHRAWQRAAGAGEQQHRHRRAGVRADLGGEACGGRVHSDAGGGDGEAVSDVGGGSVRPQGRGRGGAGVEMGGLRDDLRKVVVTSMEMFHKTLDKVEAGDNAGLLLRGVGREEIERGQVLAKPSSITPHRQFMGEVYVLRREEGGRHKAFFPGYRPQFYIRTMDVTGEITLPEGVEMVMPGDNVNLHVKLITPVALEEG